MIRRSSSRGLEASRCRRSSATTIVRRVRIARWRTLSSKGCNRAWQRRVWFLYPMAPVTEAMLRRSGRGRCIANPGRKESRMARRSPGITRLLTVAEVASVMRVSRMTVYRLIRRGQLKAIRVGRNYRVREEDLNEYLEAQAVSGV